MVRSNLLITHIEFALFSGFMQAGITKQLLLNNRGSGKWMLD